MNTNDETRQRRIVNARRWAIFGLIFWAIAGTLTIIRIIAGEPTWVTGAALVIDLYLISVNVKTLLQEGQAND